MNTKVVQEILVAEDQLRKIVDTWLEIQLRKEIKKCEELLDEVSKLIEKKWVYIKNQDVFYNNEVGALFPDLAKVELGNCPVRFVFDKNTLNLNFNGYKGKLMSLQEVIRCDKNSFSKININSNVQGITYEDENGKYCSLYLPEITNVQPTYMTSYLGNLHKLYHTNLPQIKYVEFGVGYDFYSFHIPIYRLNGENSDELSPENALKLWLKNRLIPSGLSHSGSIFYEILMEHYSKYETFGIFDKNMKLPRKFFFSRYYTDYTGTFDGVCFNREKIIEELKNKKELETVEYGDDDFRTEAFNMIKKKLLDCEKNRTNIDSYDEKILTDPNRGHWDLWDQVEQEGLYLLKTDMDLVARNPLADVKPNGIVAIDFGTKSTIVGFQETSENTQLMRVGTGNLREGVKNKHYENPTVLELKDFESFMNRYLMKSGRPETLWQDLTISHDAHESLMQSSSAEYYSYFSYMKQWAKDRDRVIRLRDQTGKDILLPNFMELENDDFNPIEIYAFYLGLYINNMRNGIYLNYTMSFPITYEMPIRQKILKSFEIGLKKSLPEAVINDEKAMGKFRVIAGASEPAAYAVTALENYGFKPRGNEKFYYGVFDFGGGTGDFDFGMWREAGKDEGRYDYVIEHFEAGGDEDLGGEKMLESCAFLVFTANQDVLRKNEITYLLSPKDQRFPGSELLLSDSQEARLNTKRMVEKLRPIWERHENYEKEFENGVLKIDLFDSKGEAVILDLQIEMSNVEKNIYKWIDEGVNNFFVSLRDSFGLDITKDETFVNIFLAGNASRSPVVKEIFEKHIGIITDDINTKFSAENEYFKIYPPLGTEEAFDLQEESNIMVDRDDITLPTGKTGVVFGLIKTRKGGKVKVIDRNVKHNEIKFKFFIGCEKKRKFNVITDRNIDYKKWYRFIDAEIDNFELYYSSLPEASTNEMEIGKAKRKCETIDITDESAFVYIRAVNPTTIEYVVARPDEIENEKYISDSIKTLNLDRT